MATIKAYSDLQQSRKLAEILPLESADNVIVSFGSREGTKTVVMPKETLNVIRTPFADIRETIMCWSLASLLNILAKIANKIDDDGSVDLSSFMGQWSVNMFDCPVEATDNYDNPIDACVAMIEKLNELNLL